MIYNSSIYQLIVEPFKRGRRKPTILARSTNTYRTNPHPDRYFLLNAGSRYTERALAVLRCLPQWAGCCSHSFCWRRFVYRLSAPLRLMRRGRIVLFPRRQARMAIRAIRASAPIALHVVALESILGRPPGSRDGAPPATALIVPPFFMLPTLPACAPQR